MCIVWKGISVHITVCTTGLVTDEPIGGSNVAGAQKSEQGVVCAPFGKHPSLPSV